MQAAVLMYVDARAESGAGVAAEVPWARWVVAHKDAGATASTSSSSTGRVTDHHKRPSAAAMALARKRQRKRQQELGDSASEASNEPDADDEEDEEEITAFVEYNANDMDSLDINPSQDFDGEISVRGDASDYRRRQQQPRPWGDSEDDTEETSEVFDNVIYAPLPSYSKPAAGSSVVTKSAIPPQRLVQTESKPVPQQSPLPEDDDDSLSDGFEVDPEFAKSLKQGHKVSSRQDTPGASANQLLWRQRRSIKRDCTFVDTDSITDSPCVSSASRQANLSSRSSIKVIELDDDDDSIESIEMCSLAEPPRVSSTGASTASTNSASTMTSTSLVVANRSAGFQPRLQKKRRKVEHQVTLDGFFRCRTFN